MIKPLRECMSGKLSWYGASLLGLSALLTMIAPAWISPATAAQVRAVNIALRRAAGRVVFCVTKDTLVLAAVDDGSAPGSQASEGTSARPPAIAPLGAGRVAVVLGAADWARDNAGQPMLLDQELPALAKKVFNSSEKIDPLDQSANDIESIGVTVLEFLRPFIDDIHYKLDLGADEPLIEIMLAGYTDGYGFEIWDLRYRVQQKNLGNDYWDTRPMRPSYHQLYPPEKGQPRTFIEARYPAKLPPLDLARAAQSDAAVSRIRASSPEINQAVTAILNGESNKAATRPVDDFLRLTLPAVAGPRAKLVVAALDLQEKFQWLLAPENLPPATPAPPPATAPSGQRTEQTERPSLRRAGPPTTR